MSDKSAIEWTDATVTLIVDRDGRRVREYVRKCPDSPGQRERREHAAVGERWCRECGEWLPSGDVTKNGLCRPHERASYRAVYARTPRIREQKVARNRTTKPIPLIAAEYLMEQFEGLCVYCEMRLATTWDHVVPRARGGRTEPGNMVPACKSCNSSKRDRDVVEWARSKGYTLTLLGEVAHLAEAC